MSHKYSFILLLAFVCITTGCAASFVNLNSARDATSFEDLTVLVGPLECTPVDAIKKCVYYNSSFNMLALESRTQIFHFHINDQSKIVWKELTETSRSYYPFIRFDLPDSFKEFK